MSPLESCFQDAADAPIGVAEMVIDGRILRLEIDRALEMFHRVFVVADAVIGPAERIHDVTIVWAQSANFLRPRSILPSAMMASRSLESSVVTVFKILIASSLRSAVSRLVA